MALLYQPLSTAVHYTGGMITGRGKLKRSDKNLPQWQSNCTISIVVYLVIEIQPQRQEVCDHLPSYGTLIFMYLLTPCSRVLLEKLTGSQLVKKFPAFYGTQRFILLILILPLALQPPVGYGLSNNTSPFVPIYHQLSPSSHSQHLKISFHFFSPSFPGSSSSFLRLVPSSSWVKIFLGILSSSWNLYILSGQSFSCFSSGSITIDNVRTTKSDHVQSHPLHFVTLRTQCMPCATVKHSTSEIRLQAAKFLWTGHVSSTGQETLRNLFSFLEREGSKLMACDRRRHAVL